MSLFKTKAVILRISKLKEKDFIYDIFTYDYGKIKVQKKEWKKEKTLDLWYIINCEIETKEWKDIHKIKNIKIKSQFICDNKDFKTINEYLSIIGIIHKKLPSWIEFKDIFELFQEINDKNNIDECKLILAKLKVIDLLWELKVDNNNELVRKILRFINKNRIKDILKLSWINNELLIKLRNLN